ncbi:50S ribosomal protein L18 [Patescibacteria group bacterium]|nr:50S ribosomal protein L18 [Patescibacteria group bacterium]
MLIKQQKKQRRQKRIRAKVIGTKECPRLSVFRSNQHIHVQLIDDQKGQTLVSSNDLKIKTIKGKGSKIEIATEIGKQIAEKALEKKINKIVFDRSGYKYHGRVKAVAEAARQAGLKF